MEHSSSPMERMEYLDSNGIKHILGRVDHPQTNGKLERLNGTVKPLKPYFSTWEEVVYYYNYRVSKHTSTHDVHYFPP